MHSHVWGGGRVTNEANPQQNGDDLQGMKGANLDYEDKSREES